MRLSRNSNGNERSIEVRSHPFREIVDFILGPRVTEVRVRSERDLSHGETWSGSSE